MKSRIKDLLTSPSIKVETFGALPDQLRNSLKLIALMSVIAMPNIGHADESPIASIQNNTQVSWSDISRESAYPHESLKKLYSDTQFVDSIKAGAEDIADTENIQLYSSEFDAYTAMGLDTSGMDNIGLSSTRHWTREYLEENQSNENLQKNKVFVIVPISGDKNAANQSKMHQNLLIGGGVGAEASYKFLVYHEFGHALDAAMFNQDLTIRNQIDKALQPFHIDQARKDILVELSSEVVGDVFATLKSQKDYYLENMDAIKEGKMDLIAPVVLRAQRVREKYGHTDSNHNTTAATREIIRMLSQEGALDALAKASDSELLMTSYAALSRTFSSFVSLAGINHPIDYPADFENEDVKPFLSFNHDVLLADKTTDKITNMLYGNQITFNKSTIDLEKFRESQQKQSTPMDEATNSLAFQRF